jgi:hypothetical protein
MPGTITHLLIAKRIIETLPEGTISNKALFYAGSIAPDAVHAKENYSRADKKKSHLSTGIHDNDMLNDQSYVDKVYERIKIFIDDYVNFDDEQLDLYIAYLIHLLTDISYILTVKRAYILLKSKDDNKDDFYKDMIDDGRLNDLKLLHKNPELLDLKEVLNDLESYSIKNIISKEEAKISLNWVVHQKLILKENIENPTYISLEMTEKFIEDTFVLIINKLSEGIEFPILFK